MSVKAQGLQPIEIKPHLLDYTVKAILIWQIVDVLLITNPIPQAKNEENLLQVLLGLDSNADLFNKQSFTLVFTFFLAVVVNFLLYLKFDHYHWSMIWFASTVSALQVYGCQPIVICFFFLNIICCMAAITRKPFAEEVIFQEKYTKLEMKK